ncbi:hypothetical protein BCR34DRAFT_670856 [Clohesyomyces aquaticus]|uniref:AAA+ ATPase domain-containing protein n=1 Tax=Clohesyomyces aquaticus TaxID=1231657 RepID=A0A1Y2A709_9PLEO|nr:hypothetical protein BCR34DRAFT_670856 [Clohesyomyces aquaticus]
MRLLHFSLSNRLVLTDFSGKTIPPYAILSHRWGDSEVLFEDIGGNTYKEKKKGYRKIEFCAEQAAKDQLQYFWIDTSINSMFRWYKDAARCYVFLPDVSASTAADIRQERAWEASFRASEWFNQGWTLQELIAPASVEFFSSEKQRIGDKTSLEQLIHEITRIPVKALQNGLSDEFTTTKEEDEVYCLLRLLNIFMSTSYGEGKEQAWRRLQIEVAAADSAPSIIPFSQNDHFVGRESQLAKLEATLFTGKKTTRMAITGPAGTGKSQLALELAYQTRRKNKSCSVFWIDASNADSLYLSYASRKGSRQWLLIFDNVDCIDLGSGGMPTAQGAANLIDYLPHKITERLELHKVTELREMTPDVARKALQNYLKAAVSEKLSYLPLAIVQAAAYINTRNITLGHYQLQLLRQKEEARERSRVPLEGRLQEYTTTGPIRSSDPLAAEYLFLAASVDRRDIPLDLLEASSPREREAAIRILNSYGLVTRRPAESALDLHQLQERLDQWSQHAITRLLKVFPDNNHRNQSKWRRLLPHARYAISHEVPKEEKGDRIDLAWKCAMALLSDGRYNEAEELFVQVMQTRKRVLGEEHLDTLTSMANLASTFWNQGRWKEAEALEAQVMETRKRVLGEEHPDTLTSMANLALTYRNQGRWKEAKELFVQVMEMRKRVLGEEHPETLTSMANLASTYRNQGRWKEAEELEVQVMETSKRVLGEEHLDTLASMANLASTYRNQGRWKEAEELEVQVMETRKRVLGEEHPDTLTSMANLASTYRNQGRWKEAKELEVQVMETFKRVLGEEHPDTLTSMANLASTYRNQGRWKEAKELFMQVMETSKRVLGEEHPDTLTSMANLASTFWNQGRWKEAEELFMQVMETSKRVLGEEHPDTLTSMANLASTYRNQGRWKEAEELFMQVMETFKRVLGEEHPDTLTGMANLASTFWNQGRWKEAEELEVQVMETFKRVLGEEHPDTLTSMANLARTWKSQNRNEEAISLMEKCFELQKRILGTHHPNIETSLEALEHDTLPHCEKVATGYRHHKQGGWPTRTSHDLVLEALQKTSRLVIDSQSIQHTFLFFLSYVKQGVRYAISRSHGWLLNWSQCLITECI